MQTKYSFFYYHKAYIKSYAILLLKIIRSFIHSFIFMGCRFLVKVYIY